jgi:hypothetical protein
VLKRRHFNYVGDVPSLFEHTAHASGISHCPVRTLFNLNPDPQRANSSCSGAATDIGAYGILQLLSSVRAPAMLQDKAVTGFGDSIVFLCSIDVIEQVWFWLEEIHGTLP